MKSAFSTSSSAIATLAIAVVMTIFTTLATVSVSEAGQRNLIRFYKVNDKGQETRLRMIGKSDEAGCHNARRTIKASRVVVLGFSWCEVYAEKDCAVQSRLAVNWDGDRRRSEKKSQSSGRMDKGTRWILNPTENISVASFSCASD